MEIATGPKNGTLGSLESGKVIYTPNKDFKGTDSFTYTGEDNESTSQPATVTIQVANPPGPVVAADTTAPSISGLKVSLRKWRLGKGLATISKAPVGTTISFSLSEAAAATLSFQRFVAAKKGGKPRYVNAGSLKALAAKAGQNKVRFQGPPDPDRSLAPASTGSSPGPATPPGTSPRSARGRASRSSTNSRPTKGPKMPKLRTRLTIAALSVLGALLVLPAAGQAATNFGSRLLNDPTETTCEKYGGTCTMVSFIHPAPPEGDPYSGGAPVDGVITKFRARAYRR